MWSQLRRAGFHPWPHVVPASGGAPYFDHTNVYAAGAGLIATYDTANYPSSYPWQVARSKSVKMCAAIDEAVPCSSRFCDERA